jgi:DnaJ-class molecular chaperone
MTSYYDILEIPKTSNEKEIKKAYRSLSLKHHPDRGGDAEKFKKISEAYETLSDPEKRQNYDNPTPENPFQHFNQSGNMSDIHEIFSTVFGGAGPFGNPFGPGSNIRFSQPNGGGGIHFINGRPHQMFHAPPPIIKNIKITLTQAYTGHLVPIEIVKNNIINNNQEEEKETIYLEIPPGIDDGEIIILRQRGSNFNNIIRGDIKIIVEVENNTKLIRSGIDLIYKPAISLKDALCGFSLEIEHITGKKMAISNTSNKSVIKPNYKKVFPNLGMKRENNTGNLIVEFDIIFPETLSESQIEKISDAL